MKEEISFTQDEVAQIREIIDLLGLELVKKDHIWSAKLRSKFDRVDNLLTKKSLPNAS